MTRHKSSRELEQLQQNLEYGEWELKVFIADILPADIKIRNEMEDRMIELENLVNTYWWVIIVKHIQNKSMPDYNTFIWEGRLDEIIEEMKREWANVLILWNILKSHQIYKINEKLLSIWAKAWDRVDLILKIFEKNAQSAEAKLQIELAAIKHMWPRIFWMGMELSKQGWWVWTRWKWETNTEIMKRHLRKKEQNIRKELEHFSKVREQHRQWRKRKWLNTVWVVGYTNAWKSTLTNSLTKKWVLAEDKLFATLWTSVWKMWIATPDWRWKEILINDTIWFIRELPPKLIDAFSSTLEDSIESDILLHVVDASDSKIEIKINVVDEILENIWAKQKRIYVFNKIDWLESKEFIIEIDWEEKKYSNYLEYLKEKFEYLNPIFISAFKKVGLDELKSRIVEELEK
jgi:GTP-binding protein HflX